MSDAVVSETGNTTSDVLSQSQNCSSTMFTSNRGNVSGKCFQRTSINMVPTGTSIRGTSTQKIQLQKQCVIWYFPTRRFSQRLESASRISSKAERPGSV